MEEGNMNLLQKTFMKAIGKMDWDMGKAYIDGKVEKHLQENGKETKWMDLGLIIY